MGIVVKHVDEAIRVDGSSSRAVLERVEISVRGLKGYSVTRPSTNVAQIAFVVNKLLGSKTHVCTVTVSNDPRRLSVSIQGDLEESRLDPLRAAILGMSIEGLREAEPGTFGPHPGAIAPPTDPPPAATSFAPPSQPAPPHPIAAAAQPSGYPTPRQPSVLQTPTPYVPPTAGGADAERGVAQPTPAWFLSHSQPQTDVVENNRTIMRPYAQNGPRPAPAVGPTGGGPRPVVARTDHGLRFELTACVLIGRDPTGRADDPAPLLIAIADQGISKTHLAMGVAGDDVWLEDRRSTNGTVILDIAGRPVIVPPAQRTLLRLPAIVVVGDTRLTISRI